MLRPKIVQNYNRHKGYMNKELSGINMRQSRLECNKCKVSSYLINKTYFYYHYIN